jgi:hypothetical protein
MGATRATTLRMGGGKVADFKVAVPAEAIPVGEVLAEDTKVAVLVDFKVADPVDTKVADPVDTKVADPVDTKVADPVDFKVEVPAGVGLVADRAKSEWRVFFNNSTVTAMARSMPKKLKPQDQEPAFSKA